MKRLLFLSAVLLIVLGSLSESAKCLNRPFTDPGWTNPPTSDGDHPWGGDNVTGGTTTSRSVTTNQIRILTGIGPVDMVLRVFFYRYFPQGKVVRNAETARPPVTSTNNTSTGSNVGNFSTAN
jgi:hypothetical protein